jgi:hypothetical protein
VENQTPTAAPKKDYFWAIFGTISAIVILVIIVKGTK